MFSIEPGMRCPGRLALVVMLFLGLLAPVAVNRALAQEIAPPESAEQTEQPAPDREVVTSPEIWLVTYGPGEIYWQRFGHNGIWIRDPELGLDHVFNFGFFDFEQEGFLMRFLQGRLMYFSAAQAAQSEFSQYINENRSIRAQRLNLGPEQALALTDYLVNEVQPENREYLYDYYWNNCSTRVRDSLDLALGGAVRDRYAAVDAKQDFREHTRRLTFADYWLYIGLELGLGSPVDQEISRWDEFFIPSVLADGIAPMDSPETPVVGPLVLEDVMIYSSSLDEPPSRAYAWWPRYLLVSVGLLAIALILIRLVPPLNSLNLSKAWLLFSAAIGSAILFIWLFTDHEVARNNLNILVFNPLWLLAWSGRRYYSVTAWLLFGLGGLALLMTVLPPHQYTADVLAACLPINLVCALVLRGVSRLPAAD